MEYCLNKKNKEHFVRNNLLNYRGFLHYKICNSCYEIRIPPVLLPKHLILMDCFIACPYYLDQKNFILYLFDNKKIIIEISLMGDDIITWLEKKYTIYTRTGEGALTDHLA